MLEEIKLQFHSLIKSIEILLVIEGLKPCARVLVAEDEIERAKKFLEGKKLNFCVSDFKLIKQSLHSNDYSDFSLKARAEDNRKGHLAFYISKDASCSKAKELEEKGNHYGLGINLGYPACCCDFFVKNFSEKSTDLTLKILENSREVDFDFPVNICARH